MTGEINYFRKRFLGGFNREDVIGYIEELAQERNKLQAEKDQAEQRLMLLSSELETLRIEIEETRKTELMDRENIIASVAAALNTFSELETTLSGLSEDVSKITERARGEFSSARERIAEFPSILEQADKRFADLLSVFDDTDAQDVSSSGGEIPKDSAEAPRNEVSRAPYIAAGSGAPAPQPERLE